MVCLVLGEGIAVAQIRGVLGVVGWMADTTARPPEFRKWEETPRGDVVPPRLHVHGECDAWKRNLDVGFASQGQFSRISHFSWKKAVDTTQRGHLRAVRREGLVESVATLKHCGMVRSSLSVA